MISNTGVVSRAWPVRVMWLVLAAYVAALALHAVGWGPSWTDSYGTFVNNGLGLAADWLPVMVCWVAISRVGFRRKEIVFGAAAVGLYAVGDTYYVAVQAMTGSVPFPSAGDVAFLGFCVLMVAALIAAVRGSTRELTSSVWLDAAVGSLGAAAVLAVLLGPVLAATVADPSLSLATAVAVAYPMLDLMLVAAIAGIAAIRGLRGDQRWVFLMVGLLAYAAADLVYALQVTAGTYVVGTPLDAVWPIGLTLVAVWVDGTATRDRSARQGTRPASSAAALAVSSVATIAGLGVLIAGTRVPVSMLAVTLAGVTLLAGAARSTLAVRLLARMAEQRRLAAATDELTGLPNRRALYAEAHTRLTERRHPSQALLMLDLDKFKEVNDNLGHRAGDQLLVQVSARLRESLRGDDVLARLGGDEFAVLLDGAGRDEAVNAAARLCATVGEPFLVEGMSLHSSISIGIALSPDDGLDLSSLLRRADIAMYKAKTMSTGHHVYCTADDVDDAARLQMVDELRVAMTHDELVLHYQPKVDLETGEVHSVEALVRWDHPVRGLLYPDAFLSVVEDSGLMPSLTRAVLALALDQVADWHRQGQQLTVSVNLSASSLGDSDLPRQIASMLAARGVPPEALQLEITEQSLLADRDRARSILTQLRHSGVEIAVDDYGTGYGSLSYLRDLPIDELKLDSSFIIPLTHDARTLALVSSTIALAHSLGLRMVAEGVETPGAYAELTRLGCDQAQGYLMSRPVPAAELDHWLNDRTDGATVDLARVTDSVSTGSEVAVV